MLFLLTWEIIKMWSKLFLCKWHKTRKDSLEKLTEEKRILTDTCFSPGAAGGLQFEPRRDDSKPSEVAPNTTVQTLVQRLKLLDSVSFYFGSLADLEAAALRTSAPAPGQEQGPALSRRQRWTRLRVSAAACWREVWAMAQGHMLGPLK